MRKEIVHTGKSEEEAINAACLLLGIPREECEWEIIDMAKTSFFGLRKRPAKVRVWVDVEGEEEIVEVAPPAVKREPVKARETQIKPKEKPVKVPARRDRDTEKRAEKVAVKIEDSKDKNTTLDGSSLEKIEVAKKYVHDIVKGMGVDSTVEVTQRGDSTWITVHGKGLGVLIGRRGETLNAIQYLTSLATNRLEGEYLRITVDCGDYRLKRNQSLEEMAERFVKQVLETDVSRTLEPMSPAERRIIHYTVSKFDGVSSTSVGNEPYRKVVIKTPTSKTKPDNRKPDSRKPDSRRRESSRPRRREKEDYSQKSESREQPSKNSSSSSNQTPVITPEAEANTPLYGKIDLD